MERAAIALGSNLGDRLLFIQTAAGHIGQDVLTNARLSTVYETPPWGITDQPRFLNAVIVGETDWKAPAILNYLKDLEREMGRRHSQVNGPREIDLDLIALGSAIERTPAIEVPHPRCYDRAFVVKPLCDVWPEWRHPIFGLTARERLASLNTAGVVAFVSGSSFSSAPVPK
ncbi:MAG: 2-amino-4-hydroxy-6-hydroxymethyldihydropteridine diphosphokinase [Deltaproteobacteria bacterium]|nr:2-amino-4-hydroxy-6-hydroxymethyldihydropteridine diphosphokinase [Deltaproteobacteria bacterium]